MKFANSVLAAALASTASAQNCATKSGQIQVIQPLTSAWKLYNNQLAFNAVVDEKLSNASDAKTAKDSAISAHHAGVASGIDSASSTKTGAVDAEHKQAQDALVTKHDQAKTAIEATYQAALTASQAAHDARQTNLDLAIVAEQDRVTAAAAADVIKADGVVAAASTKRSEATDAANAVKTADALQVTAKLAVEDTRDADIRTRYGVKLAAQIASLNEKYSGITSDIEGTKYDIAATLAALDSAGPGQAVDYAADCIVNVADAITMVKDELSPTEIWTEVVIKDGDYSARGVETFEPTNAPTDAPTDQPTDQPTDAPTDQPTDQPTAAPTEACNLGSAPAAPEQEYNANSGVVSNVPDICLQQRFHCDGSASSLSGWTCKSYTDGYNHNPMFQFPALGSAYPARQVTQVFGRNWDTNAGVYLFTYNTRAGRGSYAVGSPPDERLAFPSL
jgi:hypothetical protein